MQKELLKAENILLEKEIEKIDALIDDNFKFLNDQIFSNRSHTNDDDDDHYQGVSVHSFMGMHGKELYAEFERLDIHFKVGDSLWLKEKREKMTEELRIFLSTSTICPCSKCRDFLARILVGIFRKKYRKKYLRSAMQKYIRSAMQKVLSAKNGARITRGNFHIPKPSTTPIER